MNLFSKKIKPIKKLKILFIIDSLEVGGAEKQLVMLAKEMYLLKHQVCVYALRGDGPLIEVLENAGILVFKGLLRSERHLSSFLRGLLDLAKVIIKLRPNVLNAFLPLSSFLAAVLGKILLVKYIVISKRGLGKHQDINKKWQYLDKISNYFSHAVTVNSKSVKQDLIKRDGISKSKIICIYNGIDLDKFHANSEKILKARKDLGLHPQEYAWINVGNFVYHKGHQDLVRAFNRIHKQFNVKLFLVGRDRGTMNSIKGLISHLSEDNRIKVLGFQKNVHEILIAMDGYVGSSHTEGFSNAILEAMAANLKIVATDVGGNSEALMSGKYGKIITPNSVQSLTSAMEYTMKDNTLTETRERAKTFSKENMTSEYLKLYLEGTR